MQRVVLGIGIIGGVMGGLYLVEASHYARGTLDQPGAGAYPILVGVLMAAGALGTAREAILTKTPGVTTWPRGQETRAVITMFMAMLAYVLVVDRIGHVIAGSLLSFVVMRLFSISSWQLAVFVALVTGIGSYYVFTVLLGVPLPPGPWL